MTRKEQNHSPGDWPCPKTDDHYIIPGAVLLSDEIKHYAEKYYMVYPFKECNLKPAGIRLCLGSEYARGGKLMKLYSEPDKDELVIPPFDVAIISTEEVINLPRFIIARWNLRVSLVYEGLLWTGALQVDAGWCGPLFCPIYNLSSENVSLRLGQPIVLMDFVKTTPFNEEHSQEYRRPPKREKLEEYNYKLKSALFTQASERIDKVEKRVEIVQSLVGLSVTSIVILFAALSILVTSRGLDESVSLSNFSICWISLSIGISIIALFFALVRTPIKLEIKKRWHKIVIGCIFIFATIAVLNLLTSTVGKLITWLGSLNWFQ